MSDDPGHASSLAEQLRLAEENGNLPDELADKLDVAFDGLAAYAKLRHHIPHDAAGIRFSLEHFATDGEREEFVESVIESTE